MGITHGFVHDLYERAKEVDVTVWFEGLRIQSEKVTFHIVSQKYPAQKLIRLVEMTHVHIHQEASNQEEDILLYHDGGKEDTVINILSDHHELREAILTLAHKLRCKNNHESTDIPTQPTRE